MVSFKYLAVLLLAGIAVAEESEVVVAVVEEHARQAPEQTVPVQAPGNVRPPQLPSQEHWTEQVREAVNGANERLSNNMVIVLSSLSETMRVAGLNNTRAFASLIRSISTGVVDLTSVIAYVPRLLLLDLPNQFTEVLRLVRRNEVRVPSSVNEAIDSILVLTRQAEESGISQRVFGPITRFMPTIFNGVHDFLQVIFTTSFNVFGVGVPEAPVSPIPVPVRSPAEDQTNLNVFIGGAAPGAAGRHFHYRY